MGVDNSIGLAGNRRAVGVADRDDLGMLLTSMSDGHESIGRLTRLGNCHDERHRVDDRVAVAELTGQIDLARDPRPVLDGVLGNHAGVIRRPACDDHNFVDAAQLLRRDMHFVKD